MGCCCSKRPKDGGASPSFGGEGHRLGTVSGIGALARELVADWMALGGKRLCLLGVD